MQECQDIDPKNFVFSQITNDYNFLYPMHKLDNELTPIIFKTLMLKFVNDPIYFKSGNNSDSLDEIKSFFKKGFKIYHNDHINSNEIFDLFRKIDLYSENNKEKILFNHQKFKNYEFNISQIKYVPCIIKYKNKEYIKSYLKFRKNNIIESNNNIQLNYKIFYSGSDNYELYNLRSLKYLFKRGLSARFILKLNKLWFSERSFGWNIKILQIEVDQNKYLFLNNLNANKNMFNYNKFVKNKKNPNNSNNDQNVANPYKNNYNVKFKLLKI
jgi:hypothetical protein